MKRSELKKLIKEIICEAGNKKELGVIDSSNSTVNGDGFSVSLDLDDESDLKLKVVAVTGVAGSAGSNRVQIQLTPV